MTGSFCFEWHISFPLRSNCGGRHVIFTGNRTTHVPHVRACGTIGFWFWIQTSNFSSKWLFKTTSLTWTNNRLQVWYLLCLLDTQWTFIHLINVSGLLSSILLSSIFRSSFFRSSILKTFRSLDNLNEVLFSTGVHCTRLLIANKSDLQVFCLQALGSSLQGSGSFLQGFGSSILQSSFLLLIFRSTGHVLIQCWVPRNTLFFQKICPMPWTIKI